MATGRHLLVGGPAAARGCAEPAGGGVGVEPGQVVHEPGGDDALPADVGVGERLVDERDDALEVDDVGREERLHLAGDLVDRLRRGALLVAAGRDDARGDLRDGVARRSSVSSRFRCALSMSPGTSRLRARCACCWARTRSWLTWVCWSTGCSDCCVSVPKSCWPSSSDSDAIVPTSRL